MSRGGGAVAKRLAVLAATCGGAGYCPFAPGTAGAAVGLVPVLLLSAHPLAYAAAAVALFAAGIAASSAAEREWGRKDPPRIVIDEAASMMITFAGLPLSPWTVAAGFALNRVLDIVKPFPAGRMQDLRGGWGVMMDDAVAGLYANLLLRLALAVIHRCA